MEQTDNTCLTCGCVYTAYIVIETGDINPLWCSEDCANEYFAQTSTNNEMKID
jgi:hypothetical protein